MNTETKNCQNCKKGFTIEPRDFAFYEKIKVPAPTWCPECRSLRRMTFWNYSNLYRKTEKRTGKMLFSTYPEAAPLEIYDHDYWWSDAWDPFAYGKEVDFSKNFWEELRSLIFSVPWPNKAVRGMVNSEYCNQASYQKDCYLCFNAGTLENCLYCVTSLHLKDSMDSYSAVNSELLYEVYQGGNCFGCFYSSDIIDSRNLWFCRDCNDCSDCFGCVNLRSKKYHIFNEPYTKEEYEKKMKEFRFGSHAWVKEMKRVSHEVYMKAPHKYMHGVQNSDVSGDYVYYSKNAHDCFEVGNLEDVRYSENLSNNVKDSYDYTNWGENVELMYETISAGDGCRNLKFSFDSWPAMADSEYSLNCHSSSNLFACVGLKKAQYCILNRQYTKEQYEALVPKIKEHMTQKPYMDGQGRIYKYGEFLPPEFSPLAYNETAADEYYPKTKEEALKEGYAWRDPDQREYQITLKAGDLPDHIDDAKDGVIQEIIGCESCSKAYRILDRELAFYRRFRIPLPRLCPACRTKERISIRNPRKSYDRICACEGAASGAYQNTVPHAHGNGACTNRFQTTFSPDRKEIVYCEACYQAEVS